MKKSLWLQTLVLTKNMVELAFYMRKLRKLSPVSVKSEVTWSGGFEPVYWLYLEFGFTNSYGAFGGSAEEVYKKVIRSLNK